MPGIIQSFSGPGCAERLIQSSNPGDELRALDGAAVQHGFFVMFLNRLRPIQEIIGLELTLGLDLRSQNVKLIDTFFFECYYEHLSSA